MTGTITSADELIVQEESKKLGVEVPPKAEVAPEAQEVQEVQEVQEAPQKEESTPLEGTDEYGNEVPKPRTYTEEEVQNMIRDRLRRGQHGQQVEKAAQDFKPDPESEESWEAQLESFIEKTLHKVSSRAKEEDWRRKEQATQADFELKFSEGMSKFSDFSNVVQGKPITDSMMMATRSMKDPAAFIYAASKTQAAELERISKITDPYAQIAEVGRLEERMKKVRNATSAPKPSSSHSGDMSDDLPKRSIDQMIESHAKSKIYRR